MDHVSPAARRADHRQAVGHRGAKAHPGRGPARPGRERTPARPRPACAMPVRRGRRGQPAQFHRARHPQPARHRAEVEAARGGAGGARQAAARPCPIRRDSRARCPAAPGRPPAAPGRANAPRRRSPRGGRAGAGPAPSTTTPSGSRVQPVGPGPDQPRLASTAGRDQPHHPARIVQEDRAREEGRAAHRRRAGPAPARASSSGRQHRPRRPSARRGAISASAARKACGGLVKIKAAPPLQDARARDLERQVIPTRARRRAEAPQAPAALRAAAAGSDCRAKRSSQGAALGKAPVPDRERRGAV